MTKVTRRLALQTTLLGGAAACATTPSKTSYTAATDGGDLVFAHGVASGDPQANSVVIWTRASVPGNSSVALRWEVASGADFATILKVGQVITGPAQDYTAKALVEGLAPGGVYFYRFLLDGAVSPVGRTRTLPVGALDAARFAVVSCSNYPFGYFNVYDQIARRDDVDAVIHLGDYIYEYGRNGYGAEVGRALGREHEPAHEILSLADYRRRHAQYKADPSSRAMHAAHPLIALWDDHETSNDSWKDGAENHDPETEGSWEDRRRAALQAYYEWMPVREPEPGRTREALFRSFDYGDLLTIAALETRLMARARQFEYSEVVPTLKTSQDVAKFRDEIMWDESREMLGAAQEAYFADVFRRAADARRPWRLIANQIIMAEVIAPDLTPHVTEADIAELEAQWDQARAFIQFSTLGLPVNLDAWDGYPAARERFYQLMRDHRAEGVIVLTGDTHTWWANDLTARDKSAIGVELGVSSVTSPSPYRREFLGGKGADYALLTARENKSVRYITGEHHGYIDLLITRDRADARFMAVDTIERPVYNAFEKAAFTIRKSGGVARFAGTKGLSFKERWLF